jgi:hypothetical protein
LTKCQVLAGWTAKKKTTTPAFFLVEKCAEFLFWSKVEAAYGLETVFIVTAVAGMPRIWV